MTDSGETGSRALDDNLTAFIFLIATVVIFYVFLDICRVSSRTAVLINFNYWAASLHQW